MRRSVRDAVSTILVSLLLLRGSTAMVSCQYGYYQKQCHVDSGNTVVCQFVHLSDELYCVHSEIVDSPLDQLIFSGFFDYSERVVNPPSMPDQVPTEQLRLVGGSCQASLCDSRDDIKTGGCNGFEGYFPVGSNATSVYVC